MIWAVPEETSAELCDIYRLGWKYSLYVGHSIKSRDCNVLICFNSTYLTANPRRLSPPLWTRPRPAWLTFIMKFNLLDSVTFWSAFGALSVVFSVFVAWRIAHPKRHRLIFTMLSVRPLVDERAQNGATDPELREFKDKYILEIEVVNEGAAISANSYDEGEPLVLDVSVPIVKDPHITAEPVSGGRPPAARVGSALQIGPGYIGRSQKIHISLWVEGPGARLNLSQSKIADVDIVVRNPHTKAPPFTSEPAPSEDARRAPGPRPASRRRWTHRAALATSAGIAVISLAAVIILLVRPVQRTAARYVSTTPQSAAASPGSAEARAVLWSQPTGGYIESGPAVANGVVYVGSDDTKVYAMNAATGKVIWSYPTSGAIDSGPVVAGGGVYIGSQGRRVYAIKASGKLLWSYSTSGAVESKPTVTGGTVYVGDDYDNVYAINSATGKLRWSYSTGGNVTSSPAVTNGLLYVGSDDHTVYAIVAATGELRWSYRTGGSVDSSPAVAGGTVYIGSDDRNLYALNAASGKLLWSYPTGGAVDSGPTVVSGTIYVASEGRGVYSVYASGKLRWFFATRAADKSSPAVVDGTVYLGDNSGRVYAINAASGKLRWYYLTRGNVTSSPVVKQGIVYVGSDDNNVYALNAASG